MNEEVKKKADDDWKDQINKDKAETGRKNETYRQPTFTIFLSSLSVQAMIAMGKLENPLTGKAESNYDQARFLINTLEIIKEKTKTNITSQEETILNDYLLNLRMLYVEVKRDKDKKNEKE